MDNDVGDTAVRALIAALVLLAPAAARAHADERLAGGGEVLILTLMAATAALYAIGLLNLWRAAGRGRGVTRGEALSYAAGWVAVGIALLSPLDSAGERLFTAHM
ncbi:MAG TPA: cytochrome c oxidase assembly protein, partial [Burkholderiales bacterium]|nr:cytochrome c oxidase assembly protein [Burkholderiales bacterium]